MTEPPAGFDWTLYSQDTTSDMADWEFTDTATAHWQACANIRSFGRQPFTFPANDVVWRLGPVRGGDQYQAFISHNLAGTAAEYADIVGVQSQGLTDNPDRFIWYVRAALAQARAAKPGIPLFAGLATERLGQLLTAGQMYECWHATKDICRGYWLNVNRRPDVVVDFLRMVYESDLDAR